MKMRIDFNKGVNFGVTDKNLENLIKYKYKFHNKITDISILNKNQHELLLH